MALSELDKRLSLKDSPRQSPSSTVDVGQSSSCACGSGLFAEALHCRALDIDHEWISKHLADFSIVPTAKSYVFVDDGAALDLAS